jgi:hypothetical protein
MMMMPLAEPTPVDGDKQGSEKIFPLRSDAEAYIGENVSFAP